MHLLETAAYVVVSWTALSVFLAAGWSGFMTEARRKELSLTHEHDRHVWRSRQARLRLLTPAG